MKIPPLMVKCQIEFNMYGKILHGYSFGGLVNYVNDPRKKATLVAASDGINLTNNQTITDSFVMHAGLSSRTKKPVAHFVLAFSPHDAPRIDNILLGQLANEYLQKMGYDDNQFVAFRHYDKEHPHIHIVVNRVNFKGKCTKEAHEKDKNVKVCKDLTRKYGLYIASGKEVVKVQRLRTMDAIRYQMMHGVKESLQVSYNWKDFENELAKLAISLRFRYNTTTNGIEGVSFTIDKDKVGSRMRHDISFSGKQLDASLTLSHICERLGNPVAIVHEQARSMYEDARQKWYDTHNGFEVSRIDDIFPNFDSQFPFQAKTKMNEAPDMKGDNQPLVPELIEDLSQTVGEITDVGNGILHVGLTALGTMLFPPYQSAISAGGGESSVSKIGWGDDDKYKRKYHSNSHFYRKGRR